MKKIYWFLLASLVMGFINLSYGASEVKEVARGISIGAISVSTNTVSTMAVSGLNPFSGRYRIRIENTDSAFRIAIGTSPLMTYAQGYVVDYSSNSGNSFIDLPLNAGTTIWAIGQPNPTAGTINTRIIELK